MTQDELESLPDVTPRMGHQEQIINGRRCFIPVEVGFCGALYQKPEDGIFTDQKTGQRWVVGWQLGKRVKRQASMT